MATWTRNTECWTYVRPAQRTRYGRMAFLSLKRTITWDRKISTLNRQQPKELSSLTTYHSERSVAGTLRNSPSCIRTNMQFWKDWWMHGCSGIDNRSKVRYLMEGIKTSELDSVTTNIMATPALRTDFTACVGLYKEFIAQKDANKPSRESRLASLKTSSKQRGR